LEGWGPFIHYDDPQRQAGLDAKIDHLLRKTSLLLVDDQTLWLPSAWHAALFFLRAERYLKYADSPRHQLYRGHADPSWEIVSTFDRLPPPDRNREWTASTLFAMYLARRLYCPTLNIASYAAVARHFGFASKQMDWTVDPAVAIHFACQPMSGARDGRVFMLQVPDALEFGLEVWCLPPFCDRAYSQLGVFLRPSADDRRGLYARCPSVQFPKPEVNHPFRVWRDGNEVELLRSHPWLEESARWAREVATRLPNAIETEGGLMPLVEDGMRLIPPAPPELMPNSLLEQIQWAMRVVDLFHWLFIFISRNGRATLVPPHVGVPIVRCNRALTALAAETIRVAVRAQPDLNYHNLDRTLDALVEEAGPPEEADNDPLGALRHRGGQPPPAGPPLT
jgi:hypothetical protein